MGMTRVPADCRAGAYALPELEEVENRPLHAGELRRAVCPGFDIRQSLDGLADAIEAVQGVPLYGFTPCREALCSP